MAERAAVIKGLDLAASLGFTKVMVESASIKCLKGDIEKGAWEIYPLLLEIRSKKINFEDLHWKWSTHEANGAAHHVALLALRIVERQSWVDRPPISLVFAQGRPSLSSKLILGILAALLDNPLLVAFGKLSCFCLGYDLAEAYAPRDLHWKKLKMEKQERAKLGTAESKVVKSRLFLSGVKKNPSKQFPNHLFCRKFETLHLDGPSTAFRNITISNFTVTIFSC
ncbi:hypothetical protein ACFX13_044685 [Malus domestica]|uniref:RNase H type-1 domain-containing protein n=1 Tax=Malus domestica TaxID=3750 RepID=A0A498JBW2_MALDO|nr:hypothetical protein DVH24_006796 [Malus domestica]